MDRVYMLIMTTLMLNFVLISVYGQSTKVLKKNKTTTTTTPTTIADKIELPSSFFMKSNNKANYATINNPMQPPRSSLLDSIFNIPIQALKAVNELVQGIAGGINMMQSSYSQGGPGYEDQYSRSIPTNENAQIKKVNKYNRKGE